MKPHCGRRPLPLASDRTGRDLSNLDYYTGFNRASIGCGCINHRVSTGCEQGIPVCCRLDTYCGESHQFPGIFAHLVGVGDHDATKFEIAVAVYGPYSRPANVTCSPDNYL